jgi:hypothetical protein
MLLSPFAAPGLVGRGFFLRRTDLIIRTIKYSRCVVSHTRRTRDGCYAQTGTTVGPLHRSDAYQDNEPANIESHSGKRNFWGGEKAPKTDGQDPTTALQRQPPVNNPANFGANCRQPGNLSER